MDMKIPKDYEDKSECIAEYLDYPMSHISRTEFRSTFKVSLVHCFVVQGRDGVHIHPNYQGRRVIGVMRETICVGLRLGLWW